MTRSQQKGTSEEENEGGDQEEGEVTNCWGWVRGKARKKENEGGDQEDEGEVTKNDSAPVPTSLQHPR
eukprot:1193542-Prorocentrum_minimum.AAC.1